MPQSDEDLRLARAQTSLLKKKSSPLPRASSPSSTSQFGQDPAARHFESVTSSWICGSGKGRSPYVTSDKTSRVYEITASATWLGGSILGETNNAHSTSNQHCDNVVTVLNFGGCESVEPSSVASSYVMCGNVSNVGSGEGVSINSETFEEEASAAPSTPPRIARPSRHVTLSPTTHTSITPVISKPPTMARIAPSPTRDRHDSEFGKVLDKVAGGNHLVSPSTADNKVIDEWKEAITPEGKHYFYNRRTRASVWRAPSDGIIVPLPNQNQREEKKKEQEQGQVTSPGKTAQQTQRNLRNTAMLVRAREQFESLMDRCLTHDENSLNRFLVFCTSELTIAAAQQAEGETEKCLECGRVFSRGRLKHHQIGCATIREARPPSDSARKRIVGTPMEFSFVATKSKVVTPHRDTIRPKTSPSLSRIPL